MTKFPSTEINNPLKLDVLSHMTVFECIFGRTQIARKANCM